MATIHMTQAEVARDFDAALEKVIIRDIRRGVGNIPIVICLLTVGELADGIYRAKIIERRQHRRQFPDEIIL